MTPNMFRYILLAAVAALVTSAPASAQVVKDFVPVTDDMLLHPAPTTGSCTAARRRAALQPAQANHQLNVSQLRMVWNRGLGAGITETIPLVHKGVMYVVAPGAIVQALDGATGDLLWEYKRKVPAT